ncbi:NAD(P) transhydrogenase subunit alpha part 1 [Candidatus Bealeia paramacronuclearis]|uniref:proton-translocating NAD(P)(+) transhydrogenase n=1 Tax=Candidatus Bealeia paramacronuclearis TaxID=1921001 RepID=A0ABZ2C3V6_9PROT|nr:NAD(P) transhydrogenase subunit alpha part 1 [Candidatus Bealeia paramacronuclearis]
MKISVLKERRPYESRVAATPETIKKLVALGHEIVVESGAGLQAAFPDAHYEAAGATIAKDMKAALKGAQVVLKVQPPMNKDEGEDEISYLPEGSLLIGILSPFKYTSHLKTYAEKKISAFGLEFVPRITRAQVMDVLSSQSNLAGYRAVIETATVLPRAFPMMMTAAGTIAPAKVLILGAGVAGLQAVATAKRLGAIPSAFDVRAAAKEQVESLGGKFVTVDSEETGEGTGGYAKEMSADYQTRQREKIQETMAKSDIVITTALIPGKPAPRLIDNEMIQSMRSGSVILDLAVESGGNVEGSEIGKITEIHGVKVIGYPNLPGRIPTDASAMYAKNVLSFLSLMMPKDSQDFVIPWEDEIIQSSVLTKDGAIIHPQFKA